MSSLGTPSNATSQVWIDVEHKEMILLVGKEKVKFNLHQSIQLTDKEKKCCMRIEISLLHFDDQAPKILQEDTLEGNKFEANSFPTKELAFELTLPIPKVEEVILTRDEDENGVLATMDEGPKRRSHTSPISPIFEWSCFGMILYVAFQISNSHKGLMICLWP